MIENLNIPVISTTFGLFTKNSINRLKESNIDVISTVTSMDEAQASIDVGIKNIIFQGCEAGGHQATFIGDRINKTSTISLITKAKHKFNGIRIIAAGGVSIDNMQSFFNAGADYMQMGSIFMMSKSSGLSQACKSYIKNNFNTVVTKKITGKYARGIKSRFQKMEKLRYKFPEQHYHTSYLRKLAKIKEKFEYSSLWVGKNKDNIHEYDLEDLILKIKSKF